MSPFLPALVVHAGAGAWSEGRDEALEACSRALTAGTAVLDRGGSSLDAVVYAVRVLEDDPVCNAGTGGVLNSKGDLQLDASIMDGSTLASGAVGAIPPFEHPIDIARAVLDDGRYHLLTGEGAASFAEERGFEPSDPRTMITDRRRVELAERSQASGNTVGAVACDLDGRLASATSTGGIVAMAPGRLGDTPIVGAGTYADDRAACSCTGDGEAFARACAAFYAVCGITSGVQAAANATLARVRDAFHGSGGLILVNHAGEVGVGRVGAKMPYGISKPEKSFSFGL